MVKINGIQTDMAGMSILDTLSAHNYNPKRVAVERNGNIVPKAAYAETILQEDDVLEVVSFVGGG